jgi:hypothetical protein
VLAFLPTANFDDVVTTKPAVQPPGFELVAIDAHDTVVGLIDVAVENTVGRLDTVPYIPIVNTAALAALSRPT